LIFATSKVLPTFEAHMENAPDLQIPTARALDAPFDLPRKIWTTPDHLTPGREREGLMTVSNKMDFGEGCEWLLKIFKPDMIGLEQQRDKLVNYLGQP
jgi:hypothetical protein